MSARRNPEAGNVIIALVFALAVTTGYMAFYFSQTFAIQKLDRSRVLLGTGLKAYVASIYGHFLSQKSLIKTLKSPSNGNLWRCVNDSTFDCSANTVKTALNVIRETGDDSNPFNSAAADAGLSANLTQCTGYPSLSCPFQYRLEWFVECEGGPAGCAIPSIYVEGHLSVAAGIEGVVQLNPTSYKMLFQVK